MSIKKKVHDQVRGRVYSQVLDQLSYQVLDQVYDQVLNRVRYRVFDQVYELSSFCSSL